MLPRPRSVLIIGGGPSGLVSLRNLLERGDFERVELVERRDNIGGVWYIDSDDLDDSRVGPKDTTTATKWTSPAYPGLVGNVLPEFLGFSGFPFPERTKDYPHQPFPTLTETQDYLRSFAESFIKDRKGIVRLNWAVTRVEEQETGGWKVYLRDWNRAPAGEEIVEFWDAVVVAVGWFDNLVWPETEELDEIRSKGLAMHAKDWRGPKGFEGKRVIVVGNAASSNDIAAYLAPVVEAPVYQSIRRPAFPSFPSLPNDRIERVASVARYAVKESHVNGKLVVDATLGDGTVISDIDIVIVGTGYRPYPSLVHVLKQEDMSSDRQLVPLASLSIKPYRVPSIYRHILYAYNPTLAFIGLPMSFTPFTIADMSSTWLALAWSGHVHYPDTPQGRLEFEKKKIETLQGWLETTENPTSFLAYSVLASDEQGYASGLREEVVQVDPKLGKVLPVWSDDKTKEREAMYPLKLEALRYDRDHRLAIQQN